ncbi:MAG: hypothetical protein GX603_07250 [Chloroflexi bacterium]|mgnify:CR=1 FL=1|nr:hypothetical protein [Chloroflexota bacterium]
MKRNIQILLVFSLVLSVALLPVLSHSADAQWVDPPAGNLPTPVPWNYVPENPAVNPPGWVPENIVQQVTERPMLYVVNYETGEGKKSVNPYGTFNLKFVLGNNGKAHARNIILTFSSQDFDPLDGSVINHWEVDAQNADNVEMNHKFKVNDMSTWKYSGIITAAASYMDPDGNTYSEVFTFTITINQSGTGQVTATATPAVSARAQMVVNGYDTDVDPLQPGSTFKLTLDVRNAGSELARNVSLVYGGSTITTNPEGTPEAGGGVSGGAGDVSVFAPIGQSNVVLLGDIAAGSSLSPDQEFVVNVTAQPGAYPLKLSFVYTDAKGNRVIDDQIITLLVFSLPQLEVSFYMPVEGMFYVGQMSTLPIQITNLSRKSAVLGNAVVTSDAGDVTNNSVLVGTLDPGGYFTLDPMFIPFQEGTVTINLEIRYTDDFNQLRTYNSQLQVEVMPEIPMPEPYPLLDENGNPVLDENGNPIMIDPMNPEPFPPTGPVEEPGFFAKIWNAIKGFFGFGTGDDFGDPTMFDDSGNFGGGF